MRCKNTQSQPFCILMGMHYSPKRTKVVLGAKSGYFIEDFFHSMDLKEKSRITLSMQPGYLFSRPVAFRHPITRDLALSGKFKLPTGASGLLGAEYIQFEMFFHGVTS